MLKRLISLVCSAIFVFALLAPLSVSAESASFSLSGGNIIIGAEGDGLFVSVGDYRTTLPSGTEIVINGSNTPTSHSILIRDNVNAFVTLSGVQIESTGFLVAPLQISDAASVCLTLSGANSLSAPQYMAAIQTSRYSSLRINGSGSLTARGGMSAAAIGGGWKSGVPGTPCGNLTIEGSVTISAYGGDYGAGIGGGEAGRSGRIRISDSAKVYALGGKEAAGIGSGSGSRAKNIEIIGNAIVEAAGGEGGAGIGSGKSGNASKIAISDSASVRAAGGDSGAGIGCGQDGRVSMITVSDDAVVRARGANGAAAIGAGKNASLSVGATISGHASVFCIGGSGAAGLGGSSGAAGILSVLDSASLETYGGQSGAGIGGGKGGNVSAIRLSGRASVSAYGGIYAAGIGTGENGSYDKITISDLASVRALGGKYGSGIGGGKTSSCGTLSICGDAVVYAQGGNFGAGVGTGSKNSPDYCPTAGNIYIYDNASLHAAGGKHGAGIGGGLFSSGAVLSVSDTATVDSYSDMTVSSDLSTTAVLADYSLVNAAKSKIPSDLSPYTEQTVEILKLALSQVKYDLPVSSQAEVDAMAASIERAISILTKKTEEIVYSLKPEKENFTYEEDVTIAFDGATSSKDRVVVMKKGETLPDGTVIKSFPCLDQTGNATKSGTVSFHADELEEGEYAVYLSLGITDTVVATAYFAVSVTADPANEADYSAVDEAVNLVSTLKESDYTPESWSVLQNAITMVQAHLPKEKQATVDAFAQNVQNAIAALVPVSSVAGTASRTYRDESGALQTFTVSALTAPVTGASAPKLILLGESAGIPASPGWGMITLEPGNVEQAGADSVVSAINRVVPAEEISVNENESFDVSSIAASNLGAGAGCEMNGAFRIVPGASVNGFAADLTMTLHYGASIGSYSFAYANGSTVSLPVNPSCPGYRFKYWSTDEAGANQISGSFTLTANASFYANWEVIPVSIADEFKYASGALGLDYSDTLQFSTENSNFNCSVTSGELPPGLTLDSATGRIYGVPADLGTFNFTLLVVDANSTRTEKDYSITVFQPVQMTVTIHTSDIPSAGTRGEISFYYSYHDRGSGTLKQSNPVNVSELIANTSAAPLQPGSVDTFTLQVGAFVGEPSQLFFTNSSVSDGYRIDKVVISSPGGDVMGAFERTYQINSWIGHMDEANFFESGMFTIFVILLIVLILIVALVFYLRYRNKKRKTPAAAQARTKKRPQQTSAAAVGTPRQQIRTGPNAPGLPRDRADQATRPLEPPTDKRI